VATYLLDSDILIDALNRKRGRDLLLERLLRTGHSLACCAVNVTEIFAGTRPEEEVRVERFLGSLEYYSITRQVAKQAGRIRYEWAHRGIKVGVPDALIAAIAIAYGLVLITGNRKHFPMPELETFPLTEE